MAAHLVSQEAFSSDDFNVEAYVAACRQQLQLKPLRQELESFLTKVQNAVVELINKDYADFVSLSSNLVGVDKVLQDLRQPLDKVKEDIKVT